LSVKDGRIAECFIEGSEVLSMTSKKLIGCRHMVSEMKELFAEEKVELAEGDIYYFF
jgi:hypothetical protein